MNAVITDDTGELIAFVSDTNPSILKRGYDVIYFGNNEPVFEEIDGKVYVQENKFIIDLKE